METTMIKGLPPVLDLRSKTEGRGGAGVAVCTCDGCPEMGRLPARTRLGPLPEGVELVRLPCPRDFEPVRILELLLAGAAGVLIAGCAEGGRWGKASDYEVEDRVRLTRRLVRQAGLSPDRVAVEWSRRDEWGRAAEAVASLRAALTGQYSATPSPAVPPGLQGGGVMNNYWTIKTKGEPLAAVRNFLRGLWLQAGLSAMLAPQHAPGEAGAAPRLADDLAQLERVDPFAPLMTTNAARLAAELARAQPGARLGAVLRPCEERALAEMIKSGALKPGFLLVIGVDCLGTFPAEDYEWRAETMAGPEGLTRQSLQFARQGGVLAYRNRLACQMCAAPTPGEGADVSIGTLGLPVRRTLLITARDAATAERLHLARITDGEALPGLVRQHEQMRAVVAGRRERARQRITLALPPDLPASVPALADHLAACAPCRECLDACPLYADQFAAQPQVPGDGGAVAGISRWLSACVECGMCEAACPQRLPLTAIFARLRRAPAPSSTLGLRPKVEDRGQGLGHDSPAMGSPAGRRAEGLGGDGGRPGLAA